MATLEASLKEMKQRVGFIRNWLNRLEKEIDECLEKGEGIITALVVADLVREIGKFAYQAGMFNGAMSQNPQLKSVESSTANKAQQKEALNST